MESQNKAALDVETNVFGDVKILFFLLTLRARYEICSPAVALETATAYLAPKYFAILFSVSFT